MKRINILIIVLLSFVVIYLLYRMYINKEYNSTDYLLLMLVIIVGGINSAVILNRRKREFDNKQKNDIK
jgi:hypothetical protein